MKSFYQRLFHAAIPVMLPSSYRSSLNLSEDGWDVCNMDVDQIVIEQTAIEQYLHQHIPLSQAMAVSVTSISDRGVILSTPLLPNINHRSTAFGGSISAIAILSAWTLIHIELQKLTIPCRIVIQSNSVEYLQPIGEAFQAHCMTPPQQNWQRFIAAISKRGKGRILLAAEIYSKGVLAGKFQGEYVALKLNE